MKPFILYPKCKDFPLFDGIDVDVVENVLRRGHCLLDKKKDDR